MNLRFNDLGNWGKANYEKAILFVVLLGLLLSVGYLGLQIGVALQELAQAKWEQPDSPSKPAKTMDLADLYMAASEISDPFQIPAWTNRLMVAELRVSCVKCGKPIPYATERCPFVACAAPQPPTGDGGPGKDSDADNMPDVWEKQYGLNPHNPEDAQKDPDQDGYTNLEEYRAGTGPADSKSFPPPVFKLRLVKTQRLQLNIEFKGVQAMSATQNVYVVRNKKTGQDYYLNIGDMVQGYQVVGFEKKERKVVRGGITVVEDVSVLKLKKDNRIIELTVGRGGEGELAVQVKFLLDGSLSAARLGEDITVKSFSYKVIDITADNVLLMDKLSGKKYLVTASASTESAVSGSGSAKTEPADDEEED
ncbi:MAG: hypothetical protein HY343_09075 [Lentisphaerae bacterium]|nr:hypothetical protein [Lentisphaerota bacterium]